MKFRKTRIDDIQDVIEIINGAKNYFKEEDIDQWQKGYPNEKTIIKDIEEQRGYVLEKEEKVIATVALTFGGDPVYDTIYHGEWLSEEEYAVIRRVAVSGEYKRKGVSTKLISNIEKICIENNITNIKIVTHKKNIPMQNMLKKNNFKYCGIIYLEDGSERLAFEKII